MVQLQNETLINLFLLRIAQIVLEKKEKKTVRTSGLKYLSLKEEKLLRKTIRDTKGKKADRDMVIVDLILNTGLRAAEVVGLTVGDVRNKEKLYVRPEIAKRSKGRFIPLNKKIQAIIRQFIKLKLSTFRESISDDASLFISRKNNTLFKRTLQNVVEYWMVKAGLTTTKDLKIIPLYSVHSLRHTCFKRMRERGVALEVIQKMAGHSSLASTGIYTEATYEEMEEAVCVL